MRRAPAILAATAATLAGAAIALHWLPVPAPGLPAREPYLERDPAVAVDAESVAALREHWRSPVARAADGRLAADLAELSTRQVLRIRFRDGARIPAQGFPQGLEASPRFVYGAIRQVDPWRDPRLAGFPRRPALDTDSQGRWVLPIEPASVGVAAALEEVVPMAIDADEVAEEAELRLTFGEAADAEAFAAILDGVRQAGPRSPWGAAMSFVRDWSLDGAAVTIRATRYTVTLEDLLTVPIPGRARTGAAPAPPPLVLGFRVAHPQFLSRSVRAQILAALDDPGVRIERPETYVLVVRRGTPEHARAREIGARLREAGLRVTVRHLPDRELWETLYRREFDLFLAPWGPVEGLGPRVFYHSSGARFGWNVFGHTEAEVDRLVERWDREPRGDRRAAYIGNLLALLEDLAVQRRIGGP